MERKIRAIGPRGVIYISEATARNSKFLSKYGIMVDDESFSSDKPIAKTKIGKAVSATELREPAVVPAEIEELPKKKIKAQSINQTN